MNSGLPLKTEVIQKQQTENSEMRPALRLEDLERVTASGTAQGQPLTDIGAQAVTVAHDLRNLLAAISIAAKNLELKLPDPALGEKQFAIIHKKILESDRIINRLLSCTVNPGPPQD